MKLPAELRIYWWDRFDLDEVCRRFDISNAELLHCYQYYEDDSLNLAVEQAIQRYVENLTPTELDNAVIEALHHYRLVVHQLEEFRKNIQK